MWSNIRCIGRHHGKYIYQLKPMSHLCRHTLDGLTDRTRFNLRGHTLNGLTDTMPKSTYQPKPRSHLCGLTFYGLANLTKSNLPVHTLDGLTDPTRSHLCGRTLVGLTDTILNRHTSLSPYLTYACTSWMGWPTLPDPTYVVTPWIYWLKPC